MTLRAVLLVSVLLSGCAPAAAPVGSPSPASAPPVTLRGRVLVSVSDPAADEGLSWEIALSPDGRFVGENTWSDGATSFRSDCGGTRPATEVRRWFAWTREHARLASPQRPSGPRDFERLEVGLAYEDEGGVVRYVALSAVDEVARAWAEGFTGECL